MRRLEKSLGSDLFFKLYGNRNSVSCAERFRLGNNFKLIKIFYVSLAVYVYWKAVFNHGSLSVEVVFSEEVKARFVIRFANAIGFFSSSQRFSNPSSAY